MRKLICMVIAVCSAAVFAAASAATPSAKTEHFALVTTSTVASKPVYSVIATGAFIDGGTTTHGHKGQLTLQLSSGTITLEREKPHPHGTKTETATACMQTASSRYSFTVVQGTGAYKGISGSGRATEHDALIEQVVHGSCATHFAAAQGAISLTGRVSLP